MAILTPSSDSNEESRVITLAYFGNEFPPDDLQDLARRLHNHSKDKRHHVLARFLAETTSALRSEISNLPIELKSLLPPFESILNLVDYPELREGPLSGSIDGVLLSVIELATFIGYVRHSELLIIRIALLKLARNTQLTFLLGTTRYPALTLSSTPSARVSPVWVLVC